MEAQAQVIFCPRCGTAHRVAAKRGRLVGFRRIRCCGYWLETGSYRVRSRLDDPAGPKQAGRTRRRRRDG